MAEPASATFRKMRYEICGPNARVIGESGMAIPSTDVFAIMFTPLGAFICVSKSGLVQCDTLYAAWLRNHWNCMLSVGRWPEIRWYGSSQVRAVAQTTNMR